MSFLSCVYLLALWCETIPRQLHINLVSRLYLFSSASLPGLIYGFLFPCFLLSPWPGALCYGRLGLRQERDCAYRTSCRVRQALQLVGRAKTGPGLPAFIDVLPHAPRCTACYQHIKEPGS